ncbi:MAG: YeeE/YedE family protein [Anaerolineae bacterium]|nr:YeeE/YedE family protein [Anaerolineae bacterium]
MWAHLHASRSAQLALGLATGVAFGFLLQKGGVTQYQVILGQLLLTDFTVLKVMASAVAVGMVGVYALRDLGLVRLHPKPGSFGASVLGGLIFGVGFALLGYCPGTLAGALGQGHLDALVGGATGTVAGAWLFALWYPRLSRSVLSWGHFGAITLPEWLRVNAWVVIVPACATLVGALAWMEAAGL